MTYYTLAFATDTGGRRQFRIKNVTPGLSPADVTAAVNKLIAHNIMHPDRGALESLLHMDATTTTITRIK
ncbi:MAG: DUF2922 family protein [Defluviitaleaceae bacterium]|nr:DUF2922 family protein [Defluviitaleaceae bacterium]